MPYKPSSEQLKKVNSGHVVKLNIRDMKNGWKFTLRWWDGERNNRKHLDTQDYNDAIEARDFYEARIKAHKEAKLGITSKVKLSHLRDKLIENSQMNQLADRTIGTIKERFKKLIEFTGDRYLVELDTGLLQDYFHAQVKKGRKPGGMAVDFRHLRAGLNFAVKKGWISNNPILGVELPKVSKEIPPRISLKEFERLLKAIERDVDRRIAITLFSTGLRISEVLNLAWDKIDLDEKFMVVKGKGNKERLLPLGSLMVETLSELPRDTELVFPGRRFGKPHGTISYTRLRARFREYFDVAGIKGQGTFHRFRHGFATDIAGSGHTALEIKELLGHSTTKTTEIYAVLGGHLLRPIIDEMDKRVRQAVRGTES